LSLVAVTPGLRGSGMNRVGARDSDFRSPFGPAATGKLSALGVSIRVRVVGDEIDVAAAVRPGGGVVARLLGRKPTVYRRRVPNDRRIGAFLDALAVTLVYGEFGDPKWKVEVRLRVRALLRYLQK
jgi:hypothetical protein